MLFNSLEFLLFYPIVTAVFFLLPNKYRWFHLLAASCYFYMAFVPVYILILGLTIVIDYFAGIWIENAEGRNRRRYLCLSLIANIGVLAIFKYYNFFVENFNVLLKPLGGNAQLPLLSILLPIGLSFHTFQAMSYTIEVYRGKQKAERHFGIYALYVMFYPQLVAGPIERPQNILHQFHEEKKFDKDNLGAGLRLMLWGMFMKVAIADRLAKFADPVFETPQDYSSTALLFAAFLFSFQIFCDFAGYSLIAIGSAKTMGFNLMTNFRQPYQARSISEFWSRWHISLSTWFRDYLYIPLGGNRVAVPRWYFNLFLVFLISGFWHGAAWTFIIWGALHGIFLILGQMTKAWRTAMALKLGLGKESMMANLMEVAFTFFLVMVTWVFFRANSLSDAWYIVQNMPTAIYELMASFSSTSPLDALGMDWIHPIDIAWVFALIFLLTTVNWVQSRPDWSSWFFAKPALVRWISYYAVILGIVLLGVYENRQFIYFQF